VTAFVFVPLLALTAIVGCAVALFAAHAYQSVAESASAGNDSVGRPDEPFLDWSVRAVGVLGVAAVVAAPGGLAGLIAARLLGPAAVIPVVGVWVWVAYPPAVLAFQGGERGRRLVARPGQTASFLVLSLPALLLTGLTPGLWAVGAPFWASALAAPLSAAGLLVHARLLGRLAFLLSFVDVPEARPRRKKGKRPARKRMKVTVTDPWAVPEEEEHMPAPPAEYEDGSTGTYGISTAAPAAQPADAVSARPTILDEDDTPAPGLADQEPLAPVPRELVEPSEYEMRLARRERPKKPARAWAGTVTFLARGYAPVFVLTLAAGLALVGGLLALLSALRPPL
jgi:hypothetical protein